MEGKSNGKAVDWRENTLQHSIVRGWDGKKNGFWRQRAIHLLQGKMGEDVNGDTYRPYTWVRFFYFLCHTIRFSEASFSLLDNIIILSSSKIFSNFWFSCVPRKMIVLLALFIWPCRTPGPASLLHASCIWLSRAAYFELVIYYFKNSSYNWYYFSIFTG
jgi:hypothetical protein